jgi:hypothetical protein
LAYEWNSISLARNQIYGFLVRTRPETERVWGKKDAAKGYRKPEGIHENQIIGERSFNGAENLVIATLN